MNRKKVISTLLILVLSVQLLPLKQMISWMMRNQMTEEIVHCDSGKAPQSIDEVHKHFHWETHSTGFISRFLQSGSIHHDAERLIRRHADDIPTPPPNA